MAAAGVSLLVTVVPATAVAAQGSSTDDPGLPALPLPGPGPDTEAQPAPADAPEAQPAPEPGATPAGLAPAVPLRSTARLSGPTAATGGASAPAVPLAPQLRTADARPAAATTPAPSVPIRDDMANLVGVVAGLVLVAGAGCGVLFAGRRRNALAATGDTGARAFSRR